MCVCTRVITDVLCAVSVTSRLALSVRIYRECVSMRSITGVLSALLKIVTRLLAMTFAIQMIMDLQGSMHVWNVSLIIVCSDDDGDKCVLLAMMVLQPRCTLKALNNVSNAGVCVRVSSQQCCVQWVSYHILHAQ